MAGFALPTVLISSTIMLVVLMVSVSSTAAVRVSLAAQYYNSIAKNAADAGAVYAKSCLKANANTPTWTNPLTPYTDCSGNPIAGPNCTDDANIPTAACSVTFNTVDNIRSTFSVVRPSVDAFGKATEVVSVGTVDLLRKSGGNSWRKYNQNTKMIIADPIAQILVVGGGGAGAPNLSGGGGAGGFLEGTFTMTSGTITPVTVGAGGLHSGNVALKGGDSVFGVFTTVGGGKGSQRDTLNDAAGSGGSGGGACGYSTMNGLVPNGGAGTSGQGYSGGGGYGNIVDFGATSAGGGGGGAG
ncbi:hypothetical protein HGB25_01370, partial [Candidatus Saccharibacteria bacterium]|nr:hypothetical protein [Candidatus Saccharibacteria bacterium]